MDFDDLFKPYSPKIRGDLETYLRSCQDGCADNLFRGPKHFFEIRDKGLMIPGTTYVRVDRSPIPDTGYFVNADFMLESSGLGHQNMSLMGAPEGVYDPKVALRRVNWSISGLKLWDDESFSL